MLLAGEFELHGAAGLQDGERDDVLGEHLLLAAEAAAHALAEHAHLFRGRSKRAQSASRVRNGVCVLRADMQPPIRVEPADRAMRLEMRVLHALDI